MKGFERREWVWVVTAAGLLIVASTVPYLAGYLAQVPDLRFSGALLDRSDYHSHLAKMWQGYRGQWRYRLLFTPEEHRGVYLQTFYVALGHLARWLGWRLPLTYQVARVICSFLMLLAVYHFIALFVRPVLTRRVAFLLATTASGLGWFTEIVAPTLPGGVSPMDFWLLDGFTYLAMLTSPHFCAAIGLLLAIFLLIVRRPEGPSLVEGTGAVLASLVLGLIHPYMLLLADLLPVLYWVVDGVCTRRVAWRGLVTVAAMGMAQLFLVFYDLWVFRTQQAFVGWSAQNVTLSPPPRIYLLGYGLLLMLAIIGVVAQARRQGAWVLSFPLLWIGLVIVLAYLPWNLQRRFLEGVQVPLGLLAGKGLVEGLFPKIRWQGQARWQSGTQVAMLAVAAMSNLYLTAGLTVAAVARASALFWPVELVTGVDWLGTHTSWEETVLAGLETGNLICGRIGHRVVLGHWMETVNYDAKKDEVMHFFATSTSDEDRLALLRKWKVEWVFYGPGERGIGDFDPSEASYLEPTFQQGDVMVYEVIWEGGRKPNAARPAGVISPSLDCAAVGLVGITDDD